MSESRSENSNNELMNLLGNYSDDYYQSSIESEGDLHDASSLEDGECSNSPDNHDKEAQLRKKLLQSLNKRKSTNNDANELIPRKSMKLSDEFDESFDKCIRSKFDSINSDDEENIHQSPENKLNHIELNDENPSPILSNICDNSSSDNDDQNKEDVSNLYYPAKHGCRTLNHYSILNVIAEGAYGEVFRARERSTGRIYALKRLKLENDNYGFPITSIREVKVLIKSKHKNVVNIHEIVVDSALERVFLCLEFVEHDLKSYLKSLTCPLDTSHVKCMMNQLLSAVSHLHNNWVLHRDLKTSNILLNHHGVLKVADFGLAREYGSPLRAYTGVVVTLWYRAPELLLGQPKYSTAIDMWSVGCIMAELMLGRALFQGDCELRQLTLIFQELGWPEEDNWPGVTQLSFWRKFKLTSKQQHQKKQKSLSRNNKQLDKKLSVFGARLFNRMLCLCPSNRISADEALRHFYFEETPFACEPSQLPKYPAKSEQTITVASATSNHHSTQISNENAVAANRRRLLHQQQIKINNQLHRRI